MPILRNCRIDAPGKKTESRPWGPVFPTRSLVRQAKQPMHLYSLIRVFARHSVSSQDSKTPSRGQQRLWLASTDMQAHLSLRWAHMQFCRNCPVQTFLCHIRIEKHQYCRLWSCWAFNSFGAKFGTAFFVCFLFFFFFFLINYRLERSLYINLKKKKKKKKMNK